MSGLLERNYVRHAPEIINGKYSFTKNESDLVCALLTTINKDDEDFKTYTFTKAELEEKLGIKFHSVQLKANAKSLMSKILSVQKSENKWTFFSWFSYFDYDNGIITCRFDKAMKPYLINLKQFILSDIRLLIQIQSDYSRRIYLLLKERSKFGDRKILIENLYTILEVPKSYRNYGKFKQGILERAIKDINKFTDLEIKNLGTKENPIWFEEFKQIRKVEAITFHFKKNLNDLKSFIQYIRETHANEALYTLQNGRTLKCSDKGLLYYSDAPMEWLDEKKAFKMWETLHENRERLHYLQANLFDFEEKLKLAQ